MKSDKNQGEMENVVIHDELMNFHHANLVNMFAGSSFAFFGSLTYGVILIFRIGSTLEIMVDRFD